jgi:hypothetical protein
MVRAGLVKADPQTNQEVMSERNPEHMMMPAQPTSHFIMIKTGFSFGFFNCAVIIENHESRISTNEPTMIVEDDI